MTTSVMSDYHGHREGLAGPAEAGEWFDEQAASIMPHGGCGQVIRYGPADGPQMLRVDVDLDGQRAALRWVPDGSFAIEQDRVGPIALLKSPDRGLATVPARLARVSVATARGAVVGFVAAGRRPPASGHRPAATGHRPTGVDWAAE